MTQFAVIVLALAGFLRWLAKRAVLALLIAMEGDDAKLRDRAADALNKIETE